MKFWEFLIQKEGDRSWLPLESPSAEILAGRYRIVARSSRSSTAAEIRVTYYDAQETPPVRRVRRRSGQTNPDGLIVILPFTQLQPGLWELHCTSDLMAEMSGESWQYAMRLEVLAAAPDIADEWEPDWLAADGSGVSAEAGAEADLPLELGQSWLPVEATPEVAPVAAIVEASEPIIEPIIEPVIEATNPALPESAQFELDGLGLDELEAEGLDRGLDSGLPALQVILERESFVIQRGELLILTGQVEFPAEYPSDWQPAISELRVRLYDPQTSQMLMDEVYPIDNRIPPFPFSGTVSLPEHYQTYLVLGELILQGMTPAGLPQVLARRSFNVTTDLHELIESMANDFPDLAGLPLDAQMPAPEPIPQTELDRLTLPFQRSPQQPLPPQLRPPSPTAQTHARLDLPSFIPVSALEAQAAEPIAEDAAVAASELTEISTSAADLQPLASSIEAEASSPPANSTPAEPEPSDLPSSEPEVQSENLPEAQPAELFSDWSELESRLPIWRQPFAARPVASSDKPEDVSFRALNIQGRFWSRLQDLATSPELSADLADAEFSALTAPVARHRGLDADLTLHEVVVEDDATAPAELRAETGLAAEAPPAQGFLSEFILPEDEPIPTPRLQLPQGELVAGQPIALIVKLPSLKARVYVKLWLRDRQTRSMLGAARWLIDFLPDGFGNQMARTEVIVPLGYLKVQFEAIAVEIATQRESDKVTTTRPILPPDLSPLSLDKLEI